MIRRVTAVLLSLGALTAPAAVQAQTPHFIFTVPVRLFKLPPEIRSYSVICMITAGPRTPILGSGGKEAVVTGGVVNTDVVVNVSANTLVDPALAGYYTCSVGLLGVPPAGSAPGPTTMMYLEYGNTRFPLAPGAPFRQTTEGPIPR